MTELTDLYQELILDHSQHPHGFGELADASKKVRGYNPVCGDDITVHVRLAGDKIDAVQFTGQGCAISKASASVMTKLSSEKDRTKAAETAKEFIEAHQDHSKFEKLPVELQAFAGVSKFPMRVKCASLAWRAFMEALEK